ncbi:malto-oligosyltrehalose trehalohydrolase [Ruminobacter sp. RM87]|uniref:malto-oligosyltrehalose trehalohydrolase n=1 Tax=Ruminobacter sp. RM87 TaxID=1200567 RepID=UPI00068F69E2|nr:malto-oligosyltrehalose trehalohydrolase [Ruminobacter sp. RM87]
MNKVGYFINDEGRGCFRIFAPFCDTLAVELDRTHRVIELQKQDDGYFTAETDKLPEGILYWLVKNGTEYLPDPYSKYQPFDVHSTSMICYPHKADFSKWQGIDPKDAVIYELHIGTFTEEGTLKGATKRLSYLKTLGINVIELMPIAAFPGERNWGYDGTYMFALNMGYGNYRDLEDFLNLAHSLGIAVILDVVYNHFGPEGNYSGMLAPFTKNADTPWGAAINFDSENSHGIRDFYLANAYYWLSEIGFDGFRMDAVSLVYDSSSKHILTEINRLAKDIEEKEHRKIIMIAEHLRNDKHITSSDGFGFNAQWCDDLNYSLYSYLTHETFRHYKDFGSIDDIYKALTKGFVYDGTKLNSVYNNYQGEDGSDIPPEQLVVHIQNHDQIGNRPHGDRISTTYGIDKALLAATICFSSPYTPMIFMGEEYAEMNPFYFFESFNDQWLVDAVREGRKREFSFMPDVEIKEPHDVKTFIDSRLDMDCTSDSPHSEVLNFYQSLIALKKSKVIGIHSRNDIKVVLNKDKKIITITTPKSITVCNLGEESQSLTELGISDKKMLISSKVNHNHDEKCIEGFSARIYSL